MADGFMGQFGHIESNRTNYYTMMMIKRDVTAKKRKRNDKIA